MPITVNCSCGKIFKVKDELAGQQTTCQVCQSPVMVPLHEASADDPPPASAPYAAEAPPAAAEAAGPVTIACPYCAEEIPKNSRVCPYCSERLEVPVDEATLKEALRTMADELDVHTSSDRSVDTDRQLAGFALSGTTILLGILGMLSIVALGAGIVIRDGEALVVLGIIGLLIFGIPSLVAFSRDKGANALLTEADTMTFFKNYAMALQTKRYAKAYAALAPTARVEAGPALPVFAKLPNETKAQTIRDVKSFKKYWHAIIVGPSSHTRSMKCQKFKLLTRTDDFALVEMEMKFTSYPTWVIALIILNLLAVLIGILITQKKEVLKVRKLLVRRGDRWFVAEGSYKGVLDQVRL